MGATCHSLGLIASRRDLKKRNLRMTPFMPLKPLTTLKAYKNPLLLFCLCFSSFFFFFVLSSSCCLLASCCVRRKLPMEKRMRKQHGAEIGAVGRKRRPEVVPSWVFLFFCSGADGPPQLDSDNFSGDLSPWQTGGDSQQHTRKIRGDIL